ncbi:MAG: bifunctional 4-hydroxy-3-methylbut-2-enyl diphosphate reductase/30S ribosomal protein S1 [Oscillospiraceae bacterium]|jgi:4-hydroxy-3-methylbut-2-enyl diphosphate reductase|nr:bifunctional 4-hydroxy-3-methylbut-2-enyl diphosphate reductase/30S ribosomal protein S1 [Oscillospiraceae bacterium]
MRLVLAEAAGFCRGVRRAITICERAAAERPGVVMLGPVIHNVGVIARLEAMGVKVADGAREVDYGAPVVIRSHGAGRDEYDALRERGAEVIDATCPNVSRIHRIVRDESEAGRLPVIIGRREHPETTAIAGWCGNCVMVQSPDELADWLNATPESGRGALSVVFQTTVTREVFSLCGDILKKQCTNYKIFDTICIATRKRQREAAELAENADAMIVIGGKNSANSRRLAEICEARCARTAFIETAGELDTAAFADCATVGITAGASTPACDIKEVIQKMSEELRLDGITVGAGSPSAAEDTDVVVSGGDGGSSEYAETNQEEAPASDTASVQEVPAWEPHEGESGSAEAPAAAVAENGAFAEVAAGDAPVEDAPAGDAPGETTPGIYGGGDDENAEQDVDSEASFEEMLVKSIKTLHTGQRVKGTVISVTSTEVTVDLGAKQSGYIPASELLELDGDEPIGVGDEIEVFVARVNDVEGTVMLSKKRLNAIKNWNSIEAALADKTVVEGNVTEDNSGGVVVMVKGVRVFVPASQTGVPRDTPLASLVNSKVRLVVTEANADRRRVVGSIRAAERFERRVKAAALWEDLAPGKKYTGKVRSLLPFGAFVDIGGADGLLHVSEMSWKRIGKPEDILSVGDQIEVTVLSVDREKKKISLRYKKDEDDPWLAFIAAYAVGDVVRVKVARILAFGAFAEIMPEVDGLIHISQVSDHRVETVAGVLSVGQIVDVKIIGIDEELKRISLSIRALLEEPPLPEDDVDAENGSEPVIVYDTDAPPIVADSADSDAALGDENR